MGKNRVFRNNVTSDASRFTFYKKSIERFKFARNKPIVKKTDNFNIDYITDEIITFQDYEQFRSLTTGFYSTKSDCSLNKIIPLSITDGIQSSISYEELIAYHEDPFYDGAADVFDIEHVVNECRYKDGILYPYGVFRQSPVVNQFKFPTKVSITDCNSSLTYSDAIGAIGLRSVREDNSVSEDSIDMAKMKNTDHAHGVSSAGDEDAIHQFHLHMYPRHRRFIYYGHNHNTQQHSASLPFPNNNESVSYAVFPRHDNPHHAPDGITSCGSGIKPFSYTTPHGTSTKKLPGTIPYETICDIPSKIIARPTIEQDSHKLNKILNKNIPRGDGARGTRGTTGSSVTTAIYKEPAPRQPAPRRGSGIMHSLMYSNSKGCSKCR